MLIEELLQKEKTYKLVTGKKFKKAKVKAANKSGNIRLLDKLIVDLQTTGEITSNNAHAIKQPIRSEVTGTDVTGWVSVWVSRTDELRLLYQRYDDGTIEVKFGRPNDIGYGH